TLPRLFADNRLVPSGINLPFVLRLRNRSPRALENVICPHLPAIDRIHYHCSNYVRTPRLLFLRRNRFAVQFCRYGEVALAVAVVCKHSFDDGRLVLNYLTKSSDNFTVADLMLHPVPIRRGFDQISLCASFPESFLECPKSPAIIYAGRKTGHFPQHVRCVVLPGVERIGIVNGDWLFGAGYLFPILVEGIENVSGNRP